MSVHKFTILEEKKSRDASDIVLHRGIVTFVHITLCNNCLTLILCGNFFNNRSYSLAWSTPCSPKINHYGLVCIQSLCEIRICNNFCHNT